MNSEDQRKLLNIMDLFAQCLIDPYTDKLNKIQSELENSIKKLLTDRPMPTATPPDAPQQTEIDNQSE